MNQITRTEEVHVLHRVDRLGPEHVVLYTYAVSDGPEGRRYPTATTYWNPWGVDFATFAQSVRETLEDEIPGLLLDDETVEATARLLRNVPPHAVNTYHGD
jgi:hypothetical protein